MGRLFNKIVRHIIKKMDTDHNQLAQTTGELVKMKGTITKDMIQKCRESASEAVILLKNENQSLPIKNGEKVAVFGRCAFDYFDVGYGSGGDVSKPYSVNLIDGLKNAKVNLDVDLLNRYENWRKKPLNVPDPGYWGHWPLSFNEMPLDEKIVGDAAKRNDVAIIVIGRAAGEDRECLLKKGSYYLTSLEEKMLLLVTKYFKRSVLVMDIGNVIDYSFLDKYPVSSILLPYQGGMESGNALADVIIGKVNPSGRLSDTIAKSYEDYPSAKNFLGVDYNNYEENIYVGYRYFETFSKNKVLFPFGFGLSYTNFKYEMRKATANDYLISLEVAVKNIGDVKGKDVVQVYLHQESEGLDHPNVVLVGFKKTGIIEPREEEIVRFNINLKDFASYDDSGKTGHKNAYVLEAGKYVFYLGHSSRDLEEAYAIGYRSLEVVKEVKEAMGPRPDFGFNILINENGKEKYESVSVSKADLKERIISELPKEIPLKGEGNHRLIDVKEGKITMEEFISELSLNDLADLTRGEGGMGSSLGTVGNGGAMGGITESLRKHGIPPFIVCDGPSGLRVKVTSSLLPSGTALASTWNLDLVEALYREEERETEERHVDCLLGPGINIHRNPLCGRNFEYFSEDPLLSGLLAAACVRGMDKDGHSACPKHFCCNNQETNRSHNDSRVSERALREIYLRNFEYMVKNSHPMNIMTSYNMVNGTYSHNNYSLTETILREEWGYQGNVMTDWWMRYVTSPEFPNVTGNAYRVRSRADVLMPGAITQLKPSEIGNSLLEHYGEKDGITLGEIERCAMDLLYMIMNSSAMNRDF